MPLKTKLNGQLEEAESLLFEGQCAKALEMIRGIETQYVEVADRWRCEILEGKCLTKIGEFELALKISYSVAEEVKKTTGHDSVLVDASVILAESLWRLGRLDESLEAIEAGEQVLQTLTLHTLALHTQAHLDVSIQRPALLYHKGTVYLLQGDFDQALEYYHQSLALYEEIGNKHDIAAALNVLGLVFYRKGDLVQALEFMQRSLELREEIGNKQDIAKSLGNIGGIYTQEGDLDQALEYYERSLVIKEEMGNIQEIAYSLNNIGRVYNFKGELDRALEYYERSLTLLEEIGNKQDLAHALNNIGDVYFKKGELDRAQEYYQHSLSIREEIENNLDTSETLFSLVSVAIAMNSTDQAQQYLQRLQHINKQEKSKIIYQRSRIAESLILKTSMRARNRAKAEELLEQIVEEEIVDHELTVIALLNLCDLLLADLQISGDPGVLQDVEKYRNRLLQIAENQHSFWLLAETYVLQSKLALLNLNVIEARSLLTQAQRIADEKRLGRLAVKISNEHDALLDELDTWDELTKRQAPITERTNLVHIDDQIDGMSKRGFVEDQDLLEEEPIMLMILAGGEFVVYSKTFTQAAKMSEHLISGFVQAVQRFSHEVFSQALDRIKFETYTLLIRSEGPLTLCYVYKGQSYSAQRKLDRFIEVATSRVSMWEPLLKPVETGEGLDPPSQYALDALLTDMFLGS